MLASKLTVTIIAGAIIGRVAAVARQPCGDTFEQCTPDGTTSLELPPVGPRLGDLYTDLVQAVSPEGSTSHRTPTASDLFAKKALSVFCCAQTSQCLLLPSYGIPFCWDRFTTDYYFPDGSYGSVIAGNYTSSSGTFVNLIYGDWKSKDGSTGNIYSNASSVMPDTTTMHMPTPWTSSGVGTAIPASELGSTANITMQSTDAPTTTITAITLPSTTITVGTSECTHCNFTIIPGLTGLPPVSTAFTNGSSMPITTITVSGTGGTGLPSASSIIHTLTSIIPPINNQAVSEYVIPYWSVIIIVMDIAMRVLSF